MRNIDGITFDISEDPNFFSGNQSGDGSAKINLEYLLRIDTDTVMEDRRFGGILKETVDRIPYTAKGAVLLRPLPNHPAAKGKAGLGGKVSHLVQISYTVKGEPENDNVVISYGLQQGDLLEFFCEEFFPGMGIMGKLEITADRPFPGNTGRHYFGTLFDHVIQSVPGFARLSEAHKEWYNAYQYIRDPQYRPPKEVPLEETLPYKP